MQAASASASASTSTSTPSSSSNITYVIALTDPDAPSRSDPSSSEFCHWVASGTLKPPASPRDPTRHPCPPPPPPTLSDLRELVPYMPPTPPAGTGKHRYVFLAFVPANGGGTTTTTTGHHHPLRLSKPAGRRHWGYEVDEGETKGAREWAEENGLAPVGKSASTLFVIDGCS